jgi:hypothetical protein
MMKTSATRAVPESFWMLRIMARAVQEKGEEGGTSAGPRLENADLVKKREGLGGTARCTQEDDELSGNKVRDRDNMSAVGDGGEESLKVFGL